MYPTTQSRTCSCRPGSFRKTATLLVLRATAALALLCLNLSSASGAPGDISTIAGSPGVGDALSIAMGRPSGVAVEGDVVYLSEHYHNLVRRVDLSTGMATVAAGDGERGFAGDGGLAVEAKLKDVWDVAIDQSGNLFVADFNNARVRRVDAATGIIATVAGSGSAAFGGDGGPATAAGVHPFSVALDGAGNIFIADRSNHRVRRVDAISGVITTVAGTGAGGYSGDGGLAVSAALNFPWGIDVDDAGNLLVADTSNHRIRHVDAASGIITTVAGNGVGGFSGDGGSAAGAQLREPRGVSWDSSGDVYIADTGNNRIRKVDRSTNLISTVAGSAQAGFAGDGGPATSASLLGVNDVTLGQDGDFYIASASNSRVRRVDGSTGIIETIAGNGETSFGGDGGLARNAQFHGPHAISHDGDGNLYVAGGATRRVRRIDRTTAQVSTVAGDGSGGFSGDGGPATQAGFGTIEGVAVDDSGNIFIADQSNHRIRRVDAQTGIIETVVGTGTAGFAGDGGPGTSAALNRPLRVALDQQENLYFTDRNNWRVRRVDAATGVISTVAGSGSSGSTSDGVPAIAAWLRGPTGLTLDSSGVLYVADLVDHRVRRIDPATGVISTVAGTGASGFSGDGGPGTLAQLSSPTDVAIDSSGSLLIADRGNSRVRRVDLVSGVIETIAGRGPVGLLGGDGGPAILAALASPMGLAVSSTGDTLIADASSRRVRRIESTSPCGNWWLDPGESCDEGALNGSTESCCTAACGVRGGGALCRAAVGSCDVAEACDGVTGECPIDLLAALGATCRPPAGVCDIAETCDGLSTACPADGKSTAQCRASVDVCDVAESCDGVSNDCPIDGYAGAGVECRAAAGVCDVAESCTGSSAACPGDGKSTAECRPDTGDCDVAEVCDGVDDNCPADDSEPDGTLCDDGDPFTIDDMCASGICLGDGPVCGDGIKETPEQCDDSNTNDGDGCSSACLVESCAAQAAGLVAWWPGDDTTFDLSGNGHDGTLEDGATYSAGRENAAFDVTGSGDHVEIPDDAAWMLPGPFTIHLWANASSFGTSQNSLLAQTEGGGETNKWLFWIGPNGEDLEFHINGPNPYPVGGYVIPGVFSFSTATWYHLAVTRDVGGTYRTYVNGNEVGNGTAAMPIPDVAGSLRIGHSAESFAPITWNGLIDEVQIHDQALTQPQLADIYANGTSESCYVCGDTTVDIGEDCDDGNTTDGDCCSSMCQYETSGSVCEDGVVCTALDTCDGAGACQSGGPATTCIDAWDKANLLIKENKAGKEKFKAKIKGGPALTQADFGSPESGTTAYDICVFDDAGNLAASMSVDRAADLCAGKPCWQAKKDTGWQYKDKDASSDGVTKAKLFGGDVGKTQIQVQAANNDKKGQLSMPTGIAAALQGSASATLQILTSDAQCFEVTVDEIKKQEADFFKGIKK